MRASFKFVKKAKIIGCGLSGITAAILLKEKGYESIIFEKRDHIGGNCYDKKQNNTLVHQYGPHLFHTNDEEVFSFLSRYTDWFTFYNRPKGNTELGLISLPYSRKTVSEIGRELTQKEIIKYIFKDYSEKQWGIPFHQIPLKITNRIPKTKNCIDPTWYEGEKYQCLPKNGYTKMMECMLEGINVVLKCKNNEWEKYPADLTVYTGKIDEYFNYCYGELPYRTLRFKTYNSSTKLCNAIINQNTNAVPFTRIYDHSYFNKNHTGDTVITEEYSYACTKSDIPFYPITFGAGLDVYNKYKKKAERISNTIFLGRLATYTYLDMWMTIKQVMLQIKK